MVRTAWTEATNPKQTAAIKALERQRAAEDALKIKAAAVEASRPVAIQRALLAGIPQRHVGILLGVSEGRISQMIGRKRDTEPVAPVEPAAPVAAPKTLVTLAEGVALVSATPGAKRSTTIYKPRGTAWVNLRTHAGITDDGRTFSVPATPGTLRGLLAGLPEDITRAYLIGDRGVVCAGEVTPDAVREAFTETAGGGWEVARAGLYLADPDLPVGRWTHGVTGRTVEVHRSATWLGEAPHTIDQARDAMAALAELLRERFGTGQWLSTPSTTGRDLWRRTIPEGKTIPVLSAELRELIHATSGQGRVEILPTFHTQLDNFTYLDGRFMYAGLTWGLPVVPEGGAPHRWTRGALDALSEADRDKVLAGRGRWLVSARVPKTWKHVGILPLAGGRAGWSYPCRPGQTFTTWVDGAELALARAQGWQVAVTEGVSFKEGKPLTVWRDRLVDAWEHAAALPEPVSTLVRGAIRATLLFAIGAFAARTHTITRYGTREEAQAAGTRALAGVTMVGERFMWEEAGASTWSESMAHPEWSATIWARARVRLLDHPLPGTTARGGALALPRDQVLAFRTDALYLSKDPQWPDDGQVGRFRSKGTALGPHQMPTSPAELFALRDLAERNA